MRFAFQSKSVHNWLKLALQAESEAQHQRKVSEAEAFLKSNAASKVNLAAMHDDRPSTHDEL